MTNVSSSAMGGLPPVRDRGNGGKHSSKQVALGLNLGMIRGARFLKSLVDPLTGSIGQAVDA